MERQLVLIYFMPGIVYIEHLYLHSLYTLLIFCFFTYSYISIISIWYEYFATWYIWLIDGTRNGDTSQVHCVSVQNYRNVATPSYAVYCHA